MYIITNNMEFLSRYQVYLRLFSLINFKSLYLCYLNCVCLFRGCFCMNVVFLAWIVCFYFFCFVFLLFFFPVCARIPVLLFFLCCVGVFKTEYSPWWNIPKIWKVEWKMRTVLEISPSVAWVLLSVVCGCFVSRVPGIFFVVFGYKLYYPHFYSHLYVNCVTSQWSQLSCFCKNSKLLPLVPKWSTTGPDWSDWSSFYLNIYLNLRLVVSFLSISFA